MKTVTATRVGAAPDRAPGSMTDPEYFAQFVEINRLDVDYVLFAEFAEHLRTAKKDLETVVHVLEEQTRRRETAESQQKRLEDELAGFKGLVDLRSRQLVDTEAALEKATRRGRQLQTALEEAKKCIVENSTMKICATCESWIAGDDGTPLGDCVNVHSIYYTYKGGDRVLNRNRCECWTRRPLDPGEEDGQTQAPKT